MAPRLLTTVLLLLPFVAVARAPAQEPPDSAAGDTVIVSVPDLVVSVRAARASPRLAAFHRRRLGSSGHFVTREQIEALGSRRTTDLLRRVPGVRITRHRTYHGLERIEIGRSPPGLSHPCGAELYVDGSPVPVLERFGYRRLDLDLPSPQELEGIEVYTGAAAVPVELRARNARCGVIALWTRDEGRGSSP